MVSLVCRRSNLVLPLIFLFLFPTAPSKISGREPLVVVECCNAPDTTFHIRNSDSCHFRLCDLLFPLWLGFVCCFAFYSCYASRLMSSSALHLHFICMFFKTCIRSGSAGSLCCPFWARPHSHAPAAPPKYYFISGIKMFSEWVATCHAVLL